MIYIVINILLIAVLAGWGYKLTRHTAISAFYWPVLVIKLLAGLAVGLLYSHYYASGDSWVMMAEAVKLKAMAFSSFNRFWDIYIHSNYEAISNYAYVWQPRAAFMTKILAPLALITNNNYWLTGLYLSLFAFAGLWSLASAVLLHFHSRSMAIIPAFFTPSVVFWSSGVLKEPVAMGVMAYLLARLLAMYKGVSLKWYQLLLMLIAFLFLMHIKYYYAAVLAVVFLTLFLARYFSRRSSGWASEVGWVVLIFTLLISVASLSHPNFWPSRFMEVIVHNYQQFATKSAPAGVVSFHDLQPTFFSLLINSPKALLAGLFLPLSIHSFSWIKLAAMLENWVILFAFIYVVRNFHLPETKENRLLLYVMIVFVVIMAVFLAFSAPNYGTLSRYRIGYLLVFVTMLIAGIRGGLKRA